MNRRQFLQSITASYLLQSSDPVKGCLVQPKAHLKINTVRGPLALEQLGRTLIHEHVLVDFIGAEKVNRDRYDEEEAFRVALPFLKKIYALGCRTLVECTPAYLGRDPALLRRLSEFDGISEKSLEQHLQLVKGMIDHGFVDRTLISQDGWYHVGEPAGGHFRSYETLFTHFLPALKASGVTQEQIRKLLTDNPRQALEPRIRSRLSSETK